MNILKMAEMFTYILDGTYKPHLYGSDMMHWLTCYTSTMGVIFILYLDPIPISFSSLDVTVKTHMSFV